MSPFGVQATQLSRYGEVGVQVTVFAEIRKMCELSDGFGKAEYVGLETLCKTYGLDFIATSLNRRSDVLEESRTFFERSLS